MEQFVLSLGSNLDSAEAHEMLSKAESFLYEYFNGNISFSPHYETKGIGNGEGKMYVNSVAKGMSSHKYDDIKKILKEYEISVGRTADTKARGVVPIDLDLLSLGEEIYKPKDFLQDYVKIGLGYL